MWKTSCMNFSQLGMSAFLAICDWPRTIGERGCLVPYLLSLIWIRVSLSQFLGNLMHA
jgi:hypothetical protein